MASLFVLIIGLLIVLYSVYKMFRRAYKAGVGAKAKAKVIWQFSGALLGTAIIVSSIFF